MRFLSSDNDGHRIDISYTLVSRICVELTSNGCHPSAFAVKFAFSRYDHLQMIHYKISNGDEYDLIR